MRKHKIVISMAIILTFVGVVLSGIILVDAAKAGDKPPCKVTLALPSSVDIGTSFPISVTAWNKTDGPVYINKVAVGYGLQMLKFRGPYEVNINQQLVPAYGTTTFTVPFRILDGSGTVVGLTVILAFNAYTEDGLRGSACGGVKVN